MISGPEPASVWHACPVGDGQLYVTLKHMTDVKTKYLERRTTYTFNTWTFPADRPADGAAPAERQVECPDCGAVVSYKVLTAAAVARRRRALGWMALCGAALLVTGVVLFSNVLFESNGILGGLAFSVGLGVTIGGLVGRALDVGVSGAKAKWPDGRRAARHPVAASEVAADGRSGAGDAGRSGLKGDNPGL